MLRDRLRARLAAMGASPDYIRLAADELALRVPDPALARTLVEQALVVEDRADAWRRLGDRVRRDLPEAPGVYVMSDGAGRPIYVGKASNLRRRVTSYFAPRRWRRLPPGLTQAASIEWEPVGSELEALLKEAELIAGLTPLVNVQADAPRTALRRRRGAIRDVIVLLPSVEADCAELVCARAEGACLRQRTRRNGLDLAVHTRRIERFFKSVFGAAGSSAAGARADRLAPIVFAWLDGPGRTASRIDPHDARSSRELRARLAALLADPELFTDRIDQRWQEESRADRG